MANVIKIGVAGRKGSRLVEVEGTSVRMGSEKRFRPVGEVLGRLTKGEARKVRKALFANGYRGLAAAARAVPAPARRAA